MLVVFGEQRRTGVRLFQRRDAVMVCSTDQKRVGDEKQQPERNARPRVVISLVFDPALQP